MDELELLVQRHKNHDRQGPGSEAATTLALELSGLDREKELKIADIGCGTGASTITLARALTAQITAIDLFPDFLKVLSSRAREAGVDKKIAPLEASMDALELERESLDAIWSEGAIYHLGFEHGIQAWRPFLKPGGILAVTEITWLNSKRPKTIDDYWNENYEQIATAGTKIQQLEAHGFSLKGYFPLPPSAWFNYYEPLELSQSAFVKAHPGADAEAVVKAESEETAMYRKYQSEYSYGFYIAERRD